MAPPPPLPPPGSVKVTVNLGEKKKRHHHSKKKSQAALDSRVTYTGKDVFGDITLNPKRHKVAPGGSTPSLSMFAPPLPTILKTPIKKVLDEYGCADEKFVHAMIWDLKGIDLDRALFVMYSIDANEDTLELKHAAGGQAERSRELSSD
ncbi:PREDICTED: uncharacterized protein LOC101314643 [Fragaria vesca subsp. vesca]